jgi:hypothetical protein
MSKYSNLLQDPRWKAKRIEILKRDNFTCLHCSANNTTLHIHHTKYSGLPWEIDNKYLKTLCEKCHNKEHKNDKISGVAKTHNSLRKMLIDGYIKSDIAYIRYFGNIMKKNRANRVFIVTDEKLLILIDILIEDNCVVVFDKEKNKFSIADMYKSYKSKSENNQSNTNLLSYAKIHNIKLGTLYK